VAEAVRRSAAAVVRLSYDIRLEVRGKEAHKQLHCCRWKRRQRRRLWGNGEALNGGGIELGEEGRMTRDVVFWSDDPS
jgi:hypothetical protein